jgi:hypothetical protein
MKNLFRGDSTELKNILFSLSNFLNIFTRIQIRGKTGSGNASEKNITAA